MGERRGTKALETWCRRVTQGYPGVKVENMTTSWRDGLAFCAMIHHFRPDLIDFSRLDKSDIFGNNELAFRIAERHLGIPALLDAEDMAEYPVPDRLSILTYLSQFYQAFASNSSSPIKKPTSESPDGSLVSLVQGNVQQSSKMEEGSSLRRREPCVVCNNPVFIAQKLRIDGKLYHRTCFRCARCGTQLSIADYYETHDGQYCCETCPDEILMDAGKLKQSFHKIDDVVDAGEEIVNIQHQHQQIIKSLPPEPPPESSISTSPPPDIAVSKDPSEIERPSASLVAIRRMMFDTYNKDTDDAKLIINKKDLSDFNDSSSHKLVIDKTNSDRLIVNNNNINSSSSNHDFNKEPIREEIITNTDKDNDTSNVSDNVNNTLGDNVYKIDSDKSLPLNKISDSVEVVNDQVSDYKQEQKVVEEEDIKEQNDKESIALHAESVINQKDLASSDLDVKETEGNKKNEEEPSKDNMKQNENFTDPSPPNNDNLSTDLETTIKTDSIEYPDDLNPFGDDEEDQKEKPAISTEKATDKKSTNPFGSDSEEEEQEQETDKLLKNNDQKLPTMHKSPSLNPFGSDSEEEVEDDNAVNKPVPLPRKTLLSPEPVPFPRNRLRGSLRSINSLSSTCSLPSPRKKKPAPQPPSSPCSTLSRSPRPRKMKRAPLPPGIASSVQSLQSESSTSINNSTTDLSTINVHSTTEQNKSDIAREISNLVELISDMAVSNEDSTHPEEEQITPIQNQIKEVINDAELSMKTDEISDEPKQTPVVKKKLITLPKLDFDDSPPYQDVIPVSVKESEPKHFNESMGDLSSGNYSSYISDSASLNNSYCDSLSSPPSEKKNKDSANLHRKISEGGSIYSSKSSHGQWRRKKAPAPPLPLPKRRPVQAMPIQNIRQELNDIEIKQQGLERQGVTLENKIRDKFDSESTITPYVEELVLQLFELVNEKNELFRKQAELMYLRRQHHLEEEYAELEYQIRCLMARPEANKTDSDKELEEQLIQRLVDIVERRDAIVQCLEMDRLREAEEDKSINTQLGIFTLAMAKEVKLISKKKHKKSKDKHNSLKMMDLDKDVDESDRDTKKKKKWFTLQHIKGKHS